MKTLTPLLRQKLQVFLIFIGIILIPCVAFGLEPIGTIGQPIPRAQAFLTDDTILRIVSTHIEVVDTDTGEVIDKFGEQEQFNYVALSPTRLHIATQSFSDNPRRYIVSIWDVNTREQISTWRVESYIEIAAFSPIQPLLAISISDEISLWNWQTGERVGGMIVGRRPWKKCHEYWYPGLSSIRRACSNHPSTHDVLFTPDGKHLIVASKRPDIEIWSVETRGLVGHFEGHIDNWVEGVAMNPDGTRLASFESRSNLVYMWDVATRQLLWKEPLYVASISNMLFSLDGQYLYAAARNVHVLHVKSGQQVGIFESAFPGLEQIELSPDGKMLLQRYMDNFAVLWDIETQQELKVYANFISGANQLSPDGQTLVSTGFHVIKIWDTSSRHPRLLIPAENVFHSGTAISPDNQKLAIFKYPRSLELRDIQTGKVDMQFPHYVPGANQTTFSSSGRWIAVVGVWRDLIILDRQNPEKIYRVRPQIEQETAKLYRAAFSENGEYLVASAETGKNNQEKYWILLWKRKDDTFEFQYAWNTLQQNRSLSLASTEDGTTVLAVAGPENTRIWKILPNTAQLLTTLSDTTGPIYFSPDNQYLLTNRNDALQIWHWQTNTPLNHPSIPKYRALSRDGSVLVSRGITSGYQIWDATKILPSHAELTAVEPKGKQLVTLGQIKRAQLLQNFPNPFNPETWIPFRLANESLVTIRIYTPTGKLIRTLSPGLTPAGEHASQAKAVHWDGRNDAGEQVSSGVYLYTINAGAFSDTRKMLIKK